MKAKLYTLITGLLMAACVTSYGQEIVGDFHYTNGQTTNGCEIIEAANCTLLVGSHYSEETLENRIFVIYKFTLDGELIDSIPFSNVSKTLFASHPVEPNREIVASFMKESNNASFQIIVMDENLNIIDEKLVSIPDFSEGCSAHNIILDTQGDIIASYWDNGIFHLVRIGLDGTLKDDKGIEGLYPSAYSKPDTTLYYGSTGVFNTAPQQFSLIGAWDKGNYTPWPVVGFTFDDDFNLIDTHFHTWYDSQVAFDGGMGEHVIPFDENSYLLASRMRFAGYGHAALIKYSWNHEPLNFQIFDGNDPYRYNVPPGDTKVMPDHTICFVYLSHSSTGNSVVLVKLDEELNILWRCFIPSISGKAFGDAKIIVLNDGRIVVGAYAWYQSYSKADLHIYIIEDSTTFVGETASATNPFTFHPNPVKDQLQINILPSNEEDMLIELYSLEGKLLMREQQQVSADGARIFFDFPYTSGFYLLKITDSHNACIIKKLVK